MARKYTKRKTEYWEASSGYGDYLREYNKLNKIVDKKVKGFTYIEKAYRYNKKVNDSDEAKPFYISQKVLGRKEFIRQKNKYPDRTPEMIAAKQFVLIPEETAIQVQKNMIYAGIFKDNEKGIPYTIDEIRARKLPQEVWDQMKTVAEANGTKDKKGSAISHYFFGS